MADNGESESAGAGYAGDLSPQQAWDLLAGEPAAALIDCRTEPEFAFVGVCDLSALGKEPARIPWKHWPDMALNPDFAAQVRGVVGEGGADTCAPLLFLCRSGVRSRDAAITMTGADYTHCYNIAGGFEGDCDAGGRRGAVNGWKCAGLPWRQG